MTNAHSPCQQARRSRRRRRRHAQSNPGGVGSETPDQNPIAQQISKPSMQKCKRFSFPIRSIRSPPPKQRLAFPTGHTDHRNFGLASNVPGILPRAVLATERVVTSAGTPPSSFSIILVPGGCCRAVLRQCGLILTSYEADRQQHPLLRCRLISSNVEC